MNALRTLLVGGALGAATAVLPAAAQLPGVAPTADDPPAPLRADRLSREAIGPVVDRAVDYLVRVQHDDGSWGDDAPKILELGFALNTYRSWRLASHALSTMALAKGPETPERRAALDRAVRFLATAELPKRDSDWDIDFVWTALYGFVGCVELLQDERFSEGEFAGPLRARAETFFGVLRGHQAASGGWAYYDDPPFDVQPTWATSFCTALVLPALRDAQGLGLDVPESMIARGVRYLERCALPNGAYTYDLDPVARINGVEHINKVEGSLGRIQVAHWARRTLGDARVTDEVLREGLEQFFEHHAYLDHVRLRPIPHEGFHANAGYFYFFAHYYAARVIELLPEEEREEWHARLRPHLAKTQRASGSASDFLGSSYTVNAGTSFMVLSLEAGARQRDER
ncbi:MAG: prenyltransferase/squalene oxidase repeat-containing protein [Planctomycetota bacterium]